MKTTTKTADFLFIVSPLIKEQSSTDNILFIPDLATIKSSHPESLSMGKAEDLQAIGAEIKIATA
jgi:hypothetical protein